MRPVQAGRGQPEQANRAEPGRWKSGGRTGQRQAEPRNNAGLLLHADRRKGPERPEGQEHPQTGRRAPETVPSGP